MTTPNDIAGLVSWYQATDSYCFSDAAGTIPCVDGDLVYVWKDRKGTNNLTQSNASLRPTYRHTGGYQYVDFDGTRYMDAGSPWATSPPVSLSGWINLPANGTAMVPIAIGISGSSGNNRFVILQAATTFRMQAVTAFVAQSTIAIPAAQWSQWVGTFAAVNSRAAYLNGGNKGTNTSSSTPSGINLGRVGCTTSASSFLVGKISELAVWTSAITDQNVSDLYASGVPTVDAPTNSVAPSCTPSSGTVGQAFSCTTGTWTGSPTGYSYQWKLDGSNVGTDSSTYTPVASGTLTCTVTASNAGGPGTPAVSNSVTVTAVGGSGSRIMLLGVG